MNTRIYKMGSFIYIDDGLDVDVIRKGAFNFDINGNNISVESDGLIKRRHTINYLNVATYLNTTFITKQEVITYLSMF